MLGAAGQAAGCAGHARQCIRPQPTWHGARFELFQYSCRNAVVPRPGFEQLNTAAVWVQDCRNAVTTVRCFRSQQAFGQGSLQVPSGKGACKYLLARQPANTFWQGSPAEPAAYESIMLLLNSTRGLKLSPPTRGLQLSPPACPCRCCCTRRMPRTGRRRPGWSTSTSSPARIRSSLWNGHWR